MLPRIWAPVLLLALFVHWHAGAQSLHLPFGVIQRLRQQCPVCLRHPYDSLKLLAGNAGAYDTSFHNSILSLESGYLDEAYQYALNTLALPESGGNTALYLYARFIKAKVLYYKHLYREAATEYQQLLNKTTTDSVLISNIYANLGEIFLEQRDFEKALTWFNNWQRLFLTGADYIAAKSYYQNKALCLFHLGKYKESEPIFFTTVALEQAHHDTLGLAVSYTNLANLYYEQYLDAKAIPYFEQSYRYAQRAGDLKVVKDATRNMAVVEENRKKYPAALQYRKQYEKLQDSTWNRDQVWQLAARERKFSVQLNENKIKLLEQQAQLREAVLKTRNWQRNTLLGAALAFLVFSGFAGYAYRVKVRTSAVIARQKEELSVLNETKDRLFSIVAHDLRSPVYALKTNSSKIKSAIARNEFAEATQVAGATEKTAANTYHLLNNLLHWALCQTGQLFFRSEKIHLAAIMEQVCYDFVPLAEIKNIQLDWNIPAAVFITADLNSVKIILRNLLDNAIKYTPANGSIAITAGTVKNHCRIQVNDNGIGMEPATMASIASRCGTAAQTDTQGNRSTGFGLWLCKLLVEKNQGSLEINSKKGQGTRIDIYFPNNR